MNACMKTDLEFPCVPPAKHAEQQVSTASSGLSETAWNSWHQILSLCSKWLRLQAEPHVHTQLEVACAVVWSVMKLHQRSCDWKHTSYDSFIPRKAAFGLVSKAENPARKLKRFLRTHVTAGSLLWKSSFLHFPNVRPGTFLVCVVWKFWKWKWERLGPINNQGI